MNIRYLSFLSILAAVCFVVTASGFAQDSERRSAVEDDVRIIEGVLKPKEDEYITPDIPNLSKLYWKIGKLDIDDDKMIDYYLRINECQLYVQYFHNDFEWAKIREATREYLLENMGIFPTRFEMVIPIGVGRYDVDEESFEILEDNKIAGLRRMDFAINYPNGQDFCTRKSEIWEDYPPNIIVILNRPLVLEQFPVKQELAKLYIEEAKRVYQTMNPEEQMRQYERNAFLRLKIRVTQYKNTVTVVRGEKRAVVFGRLEGYEIYADQYKLKPLYTKDMTEKRQRRLRTRTKSSEERLGEEAELEEEEFDPLNEIDEHDIPKPDDGLKRARPVRLDD